MKSYFLLLTTLIPNAWCDAFWMHLIPKKHVRSCQKVAKTFCVCSEKVISFYYTYILTSKITFLIFSYRVCVNMNEMSFELKKLSSLCVNTSSVEHTLFWSLGS